MHEAVCLVRKMSIWGMGDCCKLFWGMGLKDFGKTGDSKIVQTHSMSFLAFSPDRSGSSLHCYSLDMKKLALSKALSYILVLI
jgi:hypothetical protein